MRSYLLSFSNKMQSAIIIGITIILAFIIATTVGSFFDHHQLRINTDLIASVYQVLGTIYAILLTFTLWGVWQKFSLADSSVQDEAYTLLDLVHVLEASSSWKNVHIRKAALEYAILVLNNEWPTLKDINSEIIKKNEPSRCASLEVVHVVQNISPQNDRESVLFSETLSLLSTWLNARRTRLLIARGNSAKALWPLLITGAFVLFSFHGLFVAQTIGIWAMLLFGFSLVIGLTFYLVFTLDCPFAGFPAVDPMPFELAITVLEQPFDGSN